MEGQVTPRSIAYAAVLVCSFIAILSFSYRRFVQLAFNLTDASHWMEVYNHFDYRALYALIIDFFEAPCDRASKKRSNDLLKWWSAYVLT